MNMQSWPDHVLNLVNSTANVIAVIAAALVLISVALIYFTGTELTGRAKQKSRPPVQVQTKSSRLSHTEIELAAARRSEEGKSVRLLQVEAELAKARRSADEAKALVKQMEEKQHPRRMTPEQRSQFLNAVRGLPKGKVIVSAFFSNKETHDLGAEILSLLKETGFNVIEPAPLDFFTTSRPSSGIRIGYQNTTNSPSHAMTVRKGFSAIGWDLPTTNLVNAHEEDVVEIQVTPKE
jgi:hypothetical protein